MTLTETNYFSPEAEAYYMGSTQFKRFMKCPAEAMAMLRGEWAQEKSTALLVGSYVDAHFSGTLDLFKAQNPDIFKKDGTLKSDYEQANYIIARIERDEMFMRYMNGGTQDILTGEIEGVPFKIKIDSYHKGKAIVDLKVIKDFAPVWDEEQRRKIPFVEFWGYDIQAAIYQSIEGSGLPFMIAAATKEKPEADIAIINIPQERIDYCREIVRQYAPIFQAIKMGEVEPTRCGHCDYCKSTKVLTEIIDYRELGK